jgi:hypothetical protein
MCWFSLSSAYPGLTSGAIICRPHGAGQGWAAALFDFCVMESHVSQRKRDMVHPQPTLVLRQTGEQSAIVSGVEGEESEVGGVSGGVGVVGGGE